MLVDVDFTDCLVLLAKDKRNRTVLIAADDVDKLGRALLSAADSLDAFMRSSGKLIVPKLTVDGAWEVAVGYYDGGVAMRFNQGGTRVPLPPAVARALAGRLQAAANAAKTGVSIAIAGRDNVRAFGPRPTV